MSLKTTIPNKSTTSLFMIWHGFSMVNLFIELYRKKKIIKNIFLKIYIATFQIIKKLLPAKAVARLKFLNAKNVKEFIDEDNLPVMWNGKNPYEYSWTQEKVTASKSLTNGSSNAMNGDFVNSKKVSSIC